MATAILTLAITTAARAQATATAPTYPSSKITGLVFGDYYSFPDHHDPAWDGQHGFWIRRAYLTYEHTFNEKLYARFRLEANSNGKLTGGNLVPFVKDLFLNFSHAPTGVAHSAHLAGTAFGVVVTLRVGIVERPSATSNTSRSGSRTLRRTSSW